MIRRSILSILFFLSINFLFSESYKIVGIEIEGLKRTRRNTVLSIIDIKEGDYINITSLEKLKQKLLKTGIFTNEVEVLIDPITEKDVDLIITLEDKWTLIPLPFFSISEGSLKTGGVFIESNLLGLNHLLVAGLIYSDSSFSGFTAWSLPEMRYGSLGLSLSFLSGKSSTMDFYGVETKLEDSFSISGGPAFTIPFNDNVSLKLTLGYSFFNKENYISNSFDLSFKDLTYTDTFIKGIDLNLGFSSELSLDQFVFYKYSIFEGSYSNILLGNLLYLGLKGAYNFDIDNFYLLFGAQKGSLVIPKNLVRTNYYGTAHLSYELNVFEFSWGYVTMPLFFEAGFLQQQYESINKSYFGPGAGMNLYMKKVAIPTMGLFYVYDIPNERYNFTFSIGATF